MTSIESDIAALQEQLKQPQTIGVKRAIENEIARLKRRVNGVGKNRKTKTADGALVGIGDTVYSYRLPYMGWESGNRSVLRKPEVSARTVAEINRAGKAKLEGGWQPIELTRSYYSTSIAAYRAMLAEATRKAKHAREQSGEAKRFLALCKAFNYKAKPKRAA